MDLRHSNWLRFFIQGKFAHVNDRDRDGYGSLEDHADFHQGFLDITMPIGKQDFTVRLGRQELQYGAQRLISPLDWGNLRRSFDGLKVMTETENWKIDAFAVRPIVNDRRNLDDEDENVDFYGVYSTWKGTESLKADVYFLVLDDHNKIPTNANGNSGKKTVYTLGSRLWGKQGSWDYETEVAHQMGHFAGDQINAWMATVGGGYTLTDELWTPRFGLLYDYASGDADPSDGTHDTFNQLYPLGHAWLGHLDKVGRSNIHALKAQLKVKPSEKLIAWADFHTFWADKDEDSLYSAGGSATNPGTTGSHLIGHELDLAVKYIIDRHTTALIGWAHMFPGGFIGSAPDEPDLFYAQVEYKF